MFFGLIFEFGFKGICVGVDNKNGKISLVGFSYYVGDEVFVFWGVKDGESCCFCFELVCGNINGDIVGLFFWFLI